MTPPEKSKADLLKYAWNRQQRALRTVQDLRAALAEAQSALDHASADLRELQPKLRSGKVTK